MDWTDFSESFREDAEKQTGITYMQLGKNNSRCEYCKSLITTNKCPNCGASK